MTKRITFLRHGQTEWNVLGRWQGQTDVALNDLGREQAREIAPAIAASGFSRIVASDLARAFETATIVAAGAPVAAEPRFRERGLGEGEGLTFAEVSARFADTPAVFDVHVDLPHLLDAESYDAVVARTTQAALELLADLAEDESVLVVAHGGAIRAAIAGLLGWPGGMLGTLRPLSNCHTATVEQSPTRGLRLMRYGVHPISHP